MKVSLAEVPFKEAANLWLETRRNYLAPRTFEGYQDHIKTLTAFFGELRLTEIDGELIRKYQAARSLRAGPSLINHECSTLQQMLKRALVWQRIAHEYQPLRLPKTGIGRCLSISEQDIYLRVAESNPDWHVAYWATLLMLRTGIGPGELRNIRLREVDSEYKTITILEGAKNPYRERQVPCTIEAWMAVEGLMRRAKSLGAYLPDHYLMPFRLKRNSYDPTRPTKGWRTVHREVCAAAGITFAPYDARRTVATRMLANPKISVETTRKVLGHISEKMVRMVYNHARHETMLEALSSLDRKPVRSVENLSKGHKSRAQK